MAEQRVIRHLAFALPGGCGDPGVGVADDGLRPLPPYASFIIGGGCPRHGS
ncbi:hypothetical protein TVNIR_2935 [Thioalkalivibrio nitratireducens DSM 14787]|uniref:Uncharacterized protein n=1 Tax=Thioalkalivibrio nitratireducens (strain DSM 14787 / UNIQEM 213 / ALEN2) TaxID=1255043 RepID=L0DZZ8_THIND|nr:hypothetical protein TVNIR_2935 [Thioalkalivibrio nitratireducens DSM 14787]